MWPVYSHVFNLLQHQIHPNRFTFSPIFTLLHEISWIITGKVCIAEFNTRKSNQVQDTMLHYVHELHSVILQYEVTNYARDDLSEKDKIIFRERG